MFYSRRASPFKSTKLTQTNIFKLNFQQPPISSDRQVTGLLNSIVLHSVMIFVDSKWKVFLFHRSLAMWHFQTVAQNSLNRKDPFPLYRDSVTATGFFSNFPKNVIFGLDSRGTFQPGRHIFHSVRNEQAWGWNIKCFAILRKATLLTKTMATTQCDAVRAWDHSGASF